MGFIDTRLIGATVLAAALAIAGGCGGSDESAKGKAASSKSKSAKDAKKAQSAADRYATAVYLAKGMPAVEVKYDLLAKPVAGQPFELELALAPRLNADLLEFTALGMPGLDVVSGGAASFQNVQGHQPYVAKVLMQPVNPGVYYVSVTAKVSSKVQTDEVAYSVPVVVAPAPAVDVAPAAGATPAATPAAAPAAPAK
jgi:hypothetical protein